MRRIVTVAAVALLVIGAGMASAQQPMPPQPPGPPLAPGPAMGHPSMGQGGMRGGMPGPGGMPAGTRGGGPGMGGMAGMGGMPEMGGMMGRRDHLEHLMVHEPKAAARIMRFRADMLRAISDVLQKHAAELEKAP